MKYTSTCCQLLALSALALGMATNQVHADQTEYTGLVSWIDMIASDVAVSDGVAYIAAFDGGLVIVDVSNPASPVTLGQLDVLNASHVVVADDIAYVSRFGTGTVVLIDVSDPTNPTQVGLIDVGLEFSSVAVNGSTLALSAAFTQLRIYDVSNPASIVMVDLIDAGEVRDIEFVDDLMYVIGSDLTIYDVSDSSNPIEIGMSFNGGQKLTVVGDYVYSLTESDGISTHNVSDPTHPVYVDTTYGVIAGGLFDLVNQDGSLYVLSYPSMYQFDLSDPTHPVRECWQFQQGTPNSLTVDDQILYIASGQNGVHIIDTNEFCDGCEADFTEEGILDFFDVSQFIILYTSSHPIADFTGDGWVDFFDISAFIAAFAAGCP